MITNQDIQNLIEIPKEIREKNPKPKKRYKQENNHKRCDLILRSLLQIQDSEKEKSHTGLKQKNTTEQNIKFKIFIRQNQDFVENFSIGLCCHISSLKTPITLIRYNGPHGPATRSKTDHHPYPHIHRITQEEIQSGSSNPKEKIIEKTNKYTTYEEGLRAFLMDMNVINWSDYFPDLEQMRLL